DLPTRLVGVEYTGEQVAETLRSLGATVAETQAPAGEGRRARRSPHLLVTPPSWRTDLSEPADLVQQIVRLRGYDQVPSVLPAAPPGGRGATVAQQRRRRSAERRVGNGRAW